MLFFGKSDLLIDHINGIKDDNRISNLRYCTARENASFENVKYKNKSSKYAGVSFDKQTGRWRAIININKNKICLGRHDREEDAAAAYNKKLNEVFLGERLRVISQRLKQNNLQLI